MIAGQNVLSIKIMNDLVGDLASNMHQGRKNIIGAV